MSNGCHSADEDVLLMCIGRSFAIMPEGYVDLKEDFEHGYGGPESTKTLQRRYDDGDQMYDPAKVPKA